MKLTTLIHKFMDFEGMEMPDGFVEKLRACGLYIYKDTILKEHLYSIDNVQEVDAEDQILFNQGEKEMILKIREILDAEDIGYFRFVFN